MWSRSIFRRSQVSPKVRRTMSKDVKPKIRIGQKRSTKSKIAGWIAAVLVFGGAGFAATRAAPRIGRINNFLNIIFSPPPAVRLSQPAWPRHCYFDASLAATSAATAGVTNLSILPP